MKKVMQEKIYKIKQTFIKFLSFFKKGLIKNASQLISGTVAAQSIVILTAPIITRIYTPEDLGYLAIFCFYNSYNWLFIYLKIRNSNSSC